MNIEVSILFRCDGSSEIGLGHVMRCLALADELHEAHKCQVAFAMRHGPPGFEIVRQQKGYPVLTPPIERVSFDYPSWLGETIRNMEAQALVLDVRDDLPCVAIERLRKQGVLVVTLDDPSERRLVTDLAFYPPWAQARQMGWAGFTGRLYVGWEWVVLRREFAHRPSKMPHEHPVVLITMGGSDPAGLTLKAVEALDMLSEEFKTVVVLGPGFSHHKALSDLLVETRRHFDVRRNVTDMPGLMAEADLAVASFGVTAYELAAMGVPAIYLGLTRDHVESAGAFVNAGMALCMGKHDQVPTLILAKAVQKLLNDKKRRQDMGRIARRYVDGQGAGRIAQVIAERIRKPS